MEGFRKKLERTQFDSEDLVDVASVRLGVWPIVFPRFFTRSSFFAKMFPHG